MYGTEQKVKPEPDAKRETRGWMRFPVSRLLVGYR